MRILIVAPRYHTNLYFRVKALQEEGYEVALFILYKQNSEKYDILEPILLKKSKINNFLNLFKNLFSNPNTLKTKLNFPQNKDLKEKIKEYNPDVIIVKNLQSVLSLMALWYARRFVKKAFLLIQTNKHYIYSRKKRFLVFILKKFFKVSAIITPLKNKLNKRDDFFKYIPFVINVNNFDKEYFKDNRINIIDIGKFTKRKDHILLLRAVNSLKDKYDLHLTIVGEEMDKSVLREVQKYIVKNNLSNIVDLKVNLKYEVVMNIYKDFDLFVLPSYNEPAAYSIIEAMANKLPIICSDTCGTNCYVEMGVNGYVFKSGDLEDLIFSIETIVRGKIKKMGLNSFSLFKNKYTVKLFKREISKLL